MQKESPSADAQIAAKLSYFFFIYVLVVHFFHGNDLFQFNMELKQTTICYRDITFFIAINTIESAVCPCVINIPPILESAIRQNCETLLGYNVSNYEIPKMLRKVCNAINMEVGRMTP